MTATDQLVCLRVLAVGEQPLRSVLEIGEHDRAGVVADDCGEPLEQRGIRLVDPDVDLAAAREPDAERQVVRDPVREEARLAAAQDLARSFVDLILDTTSGNGSGELSAFRDCELRADGAWGGPARRNDPRERHALPLRGSGSRSGNSSLTAANRSSTRLGRVVRCAAADRGAELAAFEVEAASATGGREDLGRDEETLHERGPEDEVREHEVEGHALCIGRPRACV